MFWGGPVCINISRVGSVSAATVSSTFFSVASVDA
jgi:hypothetical protein